MKPTTIALNQHDTQFDALSAASQDAEDLGLESLSQYRRQRVLGRGGMGVVWLAEQIFPVQRQVALKVASGVLSPITRTWFEVERLMLARMRHPGIAQLFDAGELADGRPYFVMEYVEGVPITHWCKYNRPSLRARMELLRRICHAVQHAHSKGLVHRDLKPANLLVLDVDGVAQPKLIDFGIASAVATQGDIAGTPGYMSPEQAEGREQTDTRSDIYSLGIVMAEVLVEIAPPKPQCSRATTLAAWQAKSLKQRIALASSCQCSEAQLTRILRSDIGPLIDACTDLDPSRRPASAQEIADEIQRWLIGAPLQLRAHERAYVLRNRLRHYRWWLAGGVLVALGLGAASLMAWQAWAEAELQRDHARRALIEADRQGKIVARVNQFLVDDVLGAANVDEYAEAETLTVRQLLEDSAQRLLKAPRNAEGADDVLMALGSTLSALGRYATAEEALRGAAARRQIVYGESDPRTLAALLAAAGVRIDQSEGAAGEELQSLLSRIQALRTAPPELVARAEMLLARHLTYLGDYARALELTQSALDRKALTRRDTEQLRAQLSWTLSRLGRHAEAIDLERELLEEVRREFGESSWPMLRGRAALASLLHRSGDLNAALKEREWVLSEMVQRFPEHTERAVQQSHYASLLVLLGRNAEAAASARIAIAMLKARFGNEHRVLGNAYSHLGAALSGQGQDVAALQAFEMADGIYREQVPATHPLRQSNDARLRAARLKLAR